MKRIKIIFYIGLIIILYFLAIQAVSHIIFQIMKPKLEQIIDIEIERQASILLEKALKEEIIKYD